MNPWPQSAGAAADSSSERLLPDVWGEGMLFAHSGMTGPTSWADDMVLSTLGDRAGFLVHGPPGLEIWSEIRRGDKRWLDGRSAGNTVMRPRLAAGDVADLQIQLPGQWGFRIRYVMRDRETLWGEIRQLDGGGFTPVVRLSAREEGVRVSGDGSIRVASDAGRAYCVRGDPLQPLEDDGAFAGVFDDDGRFAWVLARSPSKPPDAHSFNACYDRLAGFLLRVPPPPECEPELERTYYKCASVAKLNSMTAEGAIRHDWTTPDRYPHRHMWTWDSAFHALGLRHIAPQWAVASMRAVMSMQRDDGWISHSASPEGAQSDIANPALLAWAAWNVYEEHPDRDFLADALPAAGAYVTHHMTRRRPGRPPAGWIAGGAETGMDNSPRFDGRTDGVRCVDMTAYAVNEAEFLALAAMELGLNDVARDWRSLHGAWVDLVRETFWDERDRFFYDRAPDGSWIRVRTVAGFMPLFAGAATEEQAACLVERLRDRQEFWRAFPVATVSAQTPSFSADMWRGPTWINTNYMVAIGLDRYGYRDLAREIREASLQEIARWYRKTGVIWEYYDSEGIRSPGELPRKGRTGGEWIHSVIRDYHWTSALAVDLMRTRPWWA